MKKFAAFCFAIALLGVALPAITHAADGDPEPKKKKKAEMTEDQKKLSDEMIKKYDADKNGRLSTEERSKFTEEEKTKWEKLFPNQGKGGKKGKKKDA